MIEAEVDECSLRNPSCVLLHGCGFPHRKDSQTNVALCETGWFVGGNAGCVIAHAITVAVSEASPV